MTEPVPSSPPFSAREARHLLDTLRAAQRVLARRSALELAQSLGSVGRRFADPGDPLRQSAESRLPAEASLSAPMATAIIDGMAREWDTPRLERLLRADFPDPTALDRFRPDIAGQQVRAVGGSLAFHIGSGNVPGVGTTSIIRSLLVKCPVLLKPGRGDITLSQLFVRALHEADAELASAVAVMYWRRGEGGDLEELAIRNADRVVAYGGSELVRALRSRLPPTTPLVAYHHRISVGAVSREFLGSMAQAEAVALTAARSVAAFDQRGCVSPQAIWVEEGAAVDPVAWAELLALQLERLSVSLPPGPIEPAGAAALRQLQGTIQLRQGAGKGDRSFGKGPREGLVFFDPESVGVPSFAGSGRAIAVKPIADLLHLTDALGSAGRVLQTLALAAPPQRLQTLLEPLAMSGVTRVTTFDRQPWPPAWWRHDGTGALLALVRWVVLEGEEGVGPEQSP